MKTLRIKVYGIVQGVGMRPVVARHAARTGIKGTVANLGPYVEIFAQGEAAKVDEFLRLIEEEPPKRAARHPVRSLSPPISRCATSAGKNSSTRTIEGIFIRSSTAPAADRV